MDERRHRPGSLYKCSCWRGGDPKGHPLLCPTHRLARDRIWPKPMTLDLNPIKPDWNVTKQGELK